MRATGWMRSAAIGSVLALALGAGREVGARVEPVEPTAGVPAAGGFSVRTVVGELEHPWGLAWLPDGSMLITERAGRLRIVRDGKLDPTPIAGLPEIAAIGQGGLMDVSLHPNFADNKFVYLTYSAGDRNANATTLGRGRLEGGKLEGFEVLMQVPQKKRGGQHFGSRLLWLPDGTLLMSIGDGGNPPTALDGENIRNQAQKPASRLGKVLRMTADGKPAADSPLASTPGADPLVFTLGHRNIQGLARDPVSGRIWASEHGARGGDELNLIEAGKNYGWPLVTFSIEYWGPSISEESSREGFADAAVVWTPCIAPSGLIVYTGERFPAWKGAVLAGGLISNDIRVVHLDGTRAVKQESIRIGKRVRDVRQGPDGLIYVLTDEDDGALLKVEPQ
jgi:glucose/arabinose dehydrogenase